MAALPSAFRFHVSRAERSDSPGSGVAKSTTVVVPPNAAARGAGLEVVGRGDLPGGHVEVRVGVDPAGENEAAGGVEHRVRGQAQALADEGDPPAVHVQVGLVALRGGDDATVPTSAVGIPVPPGGGSYTRGGNCRRSRRRTRRGPSAARSQRRLPTRCSGTGNPPRSKRPGPGTPASKPLSTRTASWLADASSDAPRSATSATAIARRRQRLAADAAT